MRHGETAWSMNGRHTSTTDLPLTENGRRLAGRLRPVLAKQPFARVLVSPMRRARETCERPCHVDNKTPKERVQYMHQAMTATATL
jgi:broad specificity phosphatase PhoE